MNIRPKIRNAALVGALAAVTATAWATNDSIGFVSYEPAKIAAEPETTITTETVVVTEYESLSPNETVVLVSEPAPILVAEPSLTRTAITVEERRLSNDERIQAQVMDRLASHPNLSGKIGVESHDAVVTLTGYTTTAGQAYRAGREAGSIMGVKYVQNEIRPRIGGSV